MSLQLDISENEKLTFDVKIGCGNFKEGIKVTTFLRAMERHNRIYQELLRITPVEVINKIVNDLE